MYKLKIFFVVMVVLPLFAKGQDSIVLPKNYTPVIQWNTLNDSLYLEYQVLYPETWERDSTYTARANKNFFDSVFAAENIRPLLFFGEVSDTILQKRSLTETPPSNAGHKYKKPVPTWVYWAVLLVLVVIIFLKYANIKLFNHLFLASVSPRHCDEALREHDTPINIYNLVATLACLIVYALFVWFIAKAELAAQVHNSPIVVFLLTFITFAIFYMVRYIAIMIAAAVLDAEYVYGVLVQVTVSGNVWAAFIILPAVALINSTLFAFSLQTQIMYGWIIVLIYLILKQIRVFIQVGPSFPHSKVYLILYLCALEIAPYLAIYKLLVNKLG